MRRREAIGVGLVGRSGKCGTRPSPKDPPSAPPAAREAGSRLQTSESETDFKGGRLSSVATLMTPQSPVSLSKKCAWCGYRFSPNNGKQRFCSAHCREREKCRRRHVPRGSWVMDVCFECGRHFVYRSKTKRRKYCNNCPLDILAARWLPDA